METGLLLRDPQRDDLAPALDGPEATRAIRLLLGKQSLPIVASASRRSFAVVVRQRPAVGVCTHGLPQCLHLLAKVGATRAHQQVRMQRHPLTKLQRPLQFP
jgi:hypothetical protein